MSVRNSEELKLVFESGALWIDLKEPRNGALGCASHEQVTKFLACYENLASGSNTHLNNALPRISIALGDLAERSDLPLPPSLLQRFEMLKVGIANDALRDPVIATRLKSWQEQSASADRFVIVHYPDEHSDPERRWRCLLEFAKKHQIQRVLIDTKLKNGCSTLQHYPSELLRSLILQAEEQDIDTMVAGSLRLSELECAWQCGAKIIGFRSAVCVGNSRSGTIDTDRLRQLVELCSNDHF